MTGEFSFPERRQMPVVVTELMRDMKTRVMALHNASPIVVWSGSSGRGKTTTATWLTKLINAAFDPENPNAFKAHHYQIKGRADWHSVEKTAMATFHVEVIGPLDDGLYRRLRACELADLIVETLIQKRIELVFVDEAGLYSVPALRGLVAIRDQALKKGHRFSLVLIGMDDLPSLLRSNAQIEGRIKEWCFFEPYTLEETIDLALQVTDLWREADLSEPDVARQLRYLQEVTHGIPGKIVPFLQMVEAERRIHEWPLSVGLMKAAHLRTQKDLERSVEAAKGGFIERRTSPEESPKKKGA